MIKAEIKNIKLFTEFLSVATKFVQQGQLTIYKDKTALYCKNQQDFMTSRLILETNSMCLDFKSPLDTIKFCLKDLISLKSALTIVMQVENKNTCTIELEDVPPVEFEDTKVDERGEKYTVRRFENFAKSLKYTGIAKFKLISVDFRVIENFVSDALKSMVAYTFEFDINPINLDILQNKTSAIVNVSTDVSIFLLVDPETNKVVVDLNTRQTDYSNSISLPIADEYKGQLTAKNNELVFHESAFRLFNILKVREGLHAGYTTKNNALVITSEINQEDCYLKSLLITAVIKSSK